MFAVGLILQEILVNTTNEKGEMIFIDRTDPKKKLKPLNKVIFLKELAVYWELSITSPLSKLPPLEINKSMLNIINGTLPTNKIFEIFANIKVIQKNMKNAETIMNPELEVSITLEPINVKLKKIQIEQLIKTMEYFTFYKIAKFNAIKDFRQKLKDVPQADQDNYIEDFKSLFDIIQRNEKKTDFSTEDKLSIIFKNDTEDIERFMESIMNLPDETLTSEARQVIVEIEKENKHKDMQKQSGGRFGFIGGFLGGKNKDKQDAKTKELDRIEIMIQESLSQDPEETNYDLYSKLQQNDIDYIRNFIFKITLKGGSLYLGSMNSSVSTSARNSINTSISTSVSTSVNSKEAEEGLTIFYSGLETNIEKCNKGILFELKLKDYGITVDTKYAGHSSFIKLPFLQRFNYWRPLEENEYMLDFKMETNPKDMLEGYYFSGTSDAVEIIFQPILIERILNFIAVKSENERLNSTAQETIEAMRENARSKVKKTMEKHLKNYINITIEAPKIVIPFIQNGDPKNECWALDFGHLMIKNNNTINSNYDEYELELSNVQFQYYPSQNFYHLVKKISKDNELLSLEDEEFNQEKKKIYDIIEQVKINTTIKMKVNPIDEIDKPNLDMNVTVSDVKINLKPVIYSNLCKIGEHIKYSKNDAIDHIENDRLKLIQGNSKMGILYYRQTSYSNPTGIWNRYFVIFKGGYLHFFKKQTDAKSALALYIKDSDLYYVTDIIKEHCFAIENKYNTGILASDDEKQANDWINIIRAKNIEYSSISTMDKLQEEQEEGEEIINGDSSMLQKKDKNYDEILTQLVLNLTTMKITIDKDDNNNKLVQIQSKQLNMELTKKQSIIDLAIKIKSIEAIDYLFKFTSPNLIKLFTSTPTKNMAKAQESKKKALTPDLLEIKIQQKQHDHPLFLVDSTNTLVEIKFGFLFLNVKPDVIRELLEFSSGTKKVEMQPNNNRKFLHQSSSIIDDQTQERLSNQQARLSNQQARLSTQQARLSSQGRLTQTSLTIGEALIPENNEAEEKIVLFHLKLFMKKMVVRFIHEESHICLCKIPLKHTSIDIIKKKSISKIIASMKKFEINDMTNYPDTINSDIDWKSVKKNDLLNCAPDAANFLEVELISYDPKSGLGDPKRKVYSFLKVVMTKMRLSFFNQPLLRIADFINYQLFPAIYGPNPPISKETAMSSLQNAQFRDMSILIHDPIISLKTSYKSKEYIDICLGNIEINNEIVKSQERFLNRTERNSDENLLSEIMHIKLKTMSFWKVKGNERSELSKNIDVTLDVDRIIYYDESCTLYGQDDIYPGHIIKGKVTPVIFTMYHDDFLFWVKFMYFNLWYDDLLDAYFYINYEERRKRKPSKILY